MHAGISTDWRRPRGLLGLLRGTYDQEQFLSSPTREAAHGNFIAGAGWWQPHGHAACERAKAGDHKTTIKRVMMLFLAQALRVLVIRAAQGCLGAASG